MKKYLSALLALTLVLTGCQIAENKDVTHESSQLPSVSTAPTGESTVPTEAPTTAPTEPPAQELVTVQRIRRIAFLRPWGWDKEDSWVRSYAYEDGKLQYFEGWQMVCEKTFHPGTVQVASSTWYEYDEDETSCSVYEYDEKGRLIRQVSEYGTIEIYAYNDADQLTEQVTVFGDGEEYGRETWAYNEAGDETEYIRIQEGRQQARETWAYDDRGHLVEHIQYYEGALEEQQTWTYDEMGNLLEKRRTYIADEEYESCDLYTYDETGKLLESYHVGDDACDGWRYRVIYSHDEDGTPRVEARIRYDHSEDREIRDTYTYDENGNLLYSVSHYNMDGWFTETRQCTYDGAGRCTEERFTLEYEYEDELYWNTRTTYAYDEAGRMVEQVQYEDEAETRRMVWQYSDKGQLVLKQCYEYGELDYSFRCQYDEAGQLTKVSGDAFPRLRIAGDELLAMTDSDGDPIYLAVAYETCTVSPEEAEILENINEYILNTLS